MISLLSSSSGVSLYSILMEAKLFPSEELFYQASLALFSLSSFPLIYFFYLFWILWSSFCFLCLAIYILSSCSILSFKFLCYSVSTSPINIIKSPPFRYSNSLCCFINCLTVNFKSAVRSSYFLNYTFWELSISSHPCSCFFNFWTLISCTWFTINRGLKMYSPRNC